MYDMCVAYVYVCCVRAYFGGIVVPCMLRGIHACVWRAVHVMQVVDARAAAGYFTGLGIVYGKLVGRDGKCFIRALEVDFSQPARALSALQEVNPFPLAIRVGAVGQPAAAGDAAGRQSHQYIMMDANGLWCARCAWAARRLRLCICVGVRVAVLHGCWVPAFARVCSVCGPMFGVGWRGV